MFSSSGRSPVGSCQQQWIRVKEGRAGRGRIEGTLGFIFPPYLPFFHLLFVECNIVLKIQARKVILFVLQNFI